MIEKQYIQTIVNDRLAGSGYELINLEINAKNDIVVEIDCMTGVDVDYCATLNHYIIENLIARYGNVVDDYSLEVGSVSLTAPFVTKMQYQKHLGHDVEVLNCDGKKYRGIMVSVDEDTFAIDTEVIVVVEGKKRKQKQIQTLVFSYQDVKYTRYDLKF